jgi:transposase
MLKKKEQYSLTTFKLGRKCVFCGSYKVCKTKRGYIKCNKCKRQKGRRLLNRELDILVGFHQQIPALRLSKDLGVNYNTVKRVYNRMREIIYHVCELEGAKMSGQIEVDESYFGGRRKGQRGRGSKNKSLVFGLLERNGRVYTKVVYTVSAEELLGIIRKKTRKGSVYFTDSFKSYNSLKRFGKHYRIRHSTEFARKNKKYKSHINGIEGFWSYAKHGLYQYRGVSKTNFPLYLKEMEYRYNHRKENLLKSIIQLYFGYISD